MRDLIESERRLLAGRVRDGVTALAPGDAVYANFDEHGRLLAAANPPSTGYPFLSDGTMQATLVHAGPCVLLSVDLFTAEPSAGWIKIYDLARAPDPSAGDVPLWRGMAPGLAGGAGFVKAFEGGKKFENGIAFVLVSGAANNDETGLAAGDFAGNVEWR
jgi:hypothetical protein